MRITATLLLLFIGSHCLSQNQANIWYFGEGSGLDFSSGNPEYISGGQIFGYPQNELEAINSEGSSVICDSEGSLLFYSNGETIWNANNEPMPNGQGLLGMYSSTTAALIIPWPEDDQRFLVFTTDGLERDIANGVMYTVVDMCLDNGLGDVLPEQKNIPLLEFADEKLVAIPHSNGVDMWVIGHQHDTANFFAWLVTSNGVAGLIISEVGSVHEGNNYFSAIGQMKGSPNGDKLALVFSNTNPSVGELFDFNATTGEISNPISLEVNGNEYGLEFSPDQSRLYINNLSGLFQYDLTQGTEQLINESKTLIPTNGICIPAGMQAGPDGKIYCIRCSNALGVIENPNAVGVDCNYNPEGVQLETFGGQSLPSFIAGFAYQNELVDCTVESVFESSAAAKLGLYPNPAQTHLNFDENVKAGSRLTMHSMDGSVVHQLVLMEPWIDVRFLTSGIYIIQITDDSKVLTGRFAKD